MLDIKFIRENPDFVKIGIMNKNEPSENADGVNKIDKILELDKKRREIITETEQLKAQKNKVSQEIGQIKRQGGNADEQLAEMKKVADRTREADEELKAVEDELDSFMIWIPNMAHESVPIGKSADDNVEVRQWLPEGFDSENEEPIMDHLELGKKLGILDFERGAKISGAGFPVYIGKGAALERALINFMLEHHVAHHGYTEIIPPLLVNAESMRGTGQIPKLAEDMYHVEKDKLYAIPTAEVPITNMHRGEVLTQDELPIKYVGYTPCFRREAGSYGKDSKGFLRVHQFNKVEMVKLVEPETSYDELEKITANAESILKSLQIPYRVIMLCTGDLSFSAAKCYDLETWSPAENKWLEASSCSNFEDFQARRANIRFRNTETKKLEFLHTLNGSGLATSRLMVSILENYQTPEGKIIVPKVLQKYTGFEVIG